MRSSALRCNNDRTRAAPRGIESTTPAVRPVKLSNDRRSRCFWLGEIGTHRTIAVQTAIGGLGYDGSASSGFHHMARTRATRVICLGTAFGVGKCQQAFGDVLVAKSVFPYEDRDVVASGRCWEYSYSERATTYPSSREILKILESQLSKAPDPGFRVMSGCLLTGHARIRCESYRNDIVRWSRNVGTGHVIGGEMEGLGLLSLSPKNKPNWMIVKGICDFADTQQEQEAQAHRELACKNAANFVLDSLQSWVSGSG